MFFGQPFGGLITGARGAVLSILLRTGTPLTGRQVHRMVTDDFSLWSVQEALKALTHLGLVQTQTIGPAHVHTINESHIALAPLRALNDPIAALVTVVGESLDPQVHTVILFGSIARGEASLDSDIDLAVIAAPQWDGRAELEETVATRLGNNCDILVFTPSQFDTLAAQGEPVVNDILDEGVAVFGTMPRATHRAAS